MRFVHNHSPFIARRATRLTRSLQNDVKTVVAPRRDSLREATATLYEMELNAEKKFATRDTRLVAQCRACYGCISEGRSDSSHFSTAYLRLNRNPWRRIAARCRFRRCTSLRAYKTSGGSDASTRIHHCNCGCCDCRHSERRD